MATACFMLPVNSVKGTATNEFSQRYSLAYEELSPIFHFIIRQPIM